MGFAINRTKWFLVQDGGAQVVLLTVRLAVLMSVSVLLCHVSAEHLSCLPAHPAGLGLEL